MNIFIVILICIGVIILITGTYRYLNLKDESRKYIIDNTKYSVVDSPDSDNSVKMLYNINQRIIILKDYLINNIEKYPEYSDYIRALYDNTKKIYLAENMPGGITTSYTINKGEKLVICMRSPATKKMYDINLIMYVVIHELAHIACPEIGHTDLFKKIFVFLLNISAEQGIYIKINYKINPHEYCGLTIRENLT